MATIDTSTIEGFDGMTADEKVAALLGVQIPDAVDLSGYVKKDVFDSKASEAATLAKQLKAKTTEADNATGMLTTTHAAITSLQKVFPAKKRSLSHSKPERWWMTRPPSSRLWMH